MGNLDPHTLLDLAVIGFGALNAWQSSKTKLEITRLKLWIEQNFERRRTRSGDRDQED